MDSEEFREAAHAAVEEIIEYFNTLPSQRVTPTISPGYLRPLLPPSAPFSPQPWSQIQPDISSKIMPGLTHWQSPNFMAFFPATVTYPSILGELYSAAFTAPAFNWLCSPACTELETVVLDWVAQMLGLPTCFLGTGEGGGVIQGSASEAVVTVMVAARERLVRQVLEGEGLAEQPGEDSEHERRREDRAAEIRGRLVALGSEQAHSSTHKAANILGVRFRTVRAGANTGYRMTGAALRTKLEECRKEGLEPFYVTATLGTTGTCAVDDFEGLAEVKKDWPNLWVHVDAAYAGAALVCPEHREGAGAQYMGEFESFDMNLHKWLLVNFDASCLFVRSRRDLTTALSITPPYLQNPAALSGLVTDYRDWQIPLGRRFRALKIWFVIRSYGIEGLQALIRKHVSLGEIFAGCVRRRRDLFEVIAGPAYALTVIRCRAPANDTAVRDEMENPLSNGCKASINNPDDEVNGHGDAGPASASSQHSLGTKASVVSAASNAITKEVYELINSRGEIFLTSSVIDGVYVIRVVSANPMADEQHVRRAFEILVEATEEVRAAKER